MTLPPDSRPVPDSQPPSPAPDERLFHPDRALDWCFRNIVPIALGPLGLLLALDVARGLLGPRRSPAALMWADLSDWIFVSLTFALLAGALLFGRLLRQMPDALVQLGDSGRLLPRPGRAYPAAQQRPRRLLAGGPAAPHPSFCNLCAHTRIRRAGQDEARQLLRRFHAGSGSQVSHPQVGRC